MLLHKFHAAKQSEIAMLQKLADAGELSPKPNIIRQSFIKALQTENNGQPHIIAEYKRASPSKGDIALNLNVQDVVNQYAQAGATCVSILTEEKFFKGHMDYIAKAEPCNLPLLRKDFIFDSLQILHTATTPASALLLIVALTPDVKILRDLREQAESFGIDAVVEIFSHSELALAKDSGARIIQVNARNLSTFEIDRDECLKIGKMNIQKHSSEVWIAASGISKYQDLADAHNAGYDAVLVGTQLMQNGKPYEDLMYLRTGG